MRLGPQPAHSFDQAIIDVDGTFVGTDAECSEGLDIANHGTWGYHPLLVSLANTKEPLYLVNRSGNRPRMNWAASFLDRAVSPLPPGRLPLVSGAGAYRLHPDEQLDRWDDAGDVRFLFGIDARPNQAALAERLPDSAYSFLERPVASDQDRPRQRPHGTKHESSRSGASRPFTRWRRWLLSSIIGRWRASGIIAVGVRKRLAIESGAGADPLRSTATSFSSLMTARCRPIKPC